MLTVASTPSARCDALCVQVLGGHPPGHRVYVGASLCTCDMCALTYLMRLGVQECFGLLCDLTHARWPPGSGVMSDLFFFFWCVCLVRGCIALEFGLVSLGLHCFLRLYTVTCPLLG